MAARSELDVRVRGIDELTPELSKLESKIIRWVGAVSASLAAIRVGIAPIKAAADFEREMANVAKTTDFGKKQISLMADELLRLSLTTDTTTLDLVKIASIAGQMGLGDQGVEGIVKFTESVARMSSVLDVSAEVAAEAIGKIRNIFRIPIGETERIVSAFNQVSNNSTASGEELLDIVKRIGDATGAINLQQSMGLAASGIDFGVNPEVVGTSFSKIFAQLQSKADEFGKLMNVSATQWIGMVQTDGLLAFKRLLAKLRELNPQAQQETIAKLLGGGRIGALVNKLVQDVNDDVLNRNVKQAQEGFTSGLSAIKEQLVVLNTFNAQFEILKNSIFKAGAEMGNEALSPLTSSLARLSQALQSDAFKSFGKAIGQSMLRLADNVERLVTFMASLNINWENFLVLGEALLKLKLATVILGWISRLTGYGTALQLIANRSKEAATATAALGTATTAASAKIEAGWLARKLGIAQEVIAIKQLNAERQASAAAEAKRQADLLAAQRSLNAANTVVASQGGKRAAAENQVKQANVVVGQSAAQVSAASNALRTSQAKAAADELNIRTAAQAALQARETKHTAALLAIEQKYATQKAAILATGSKKGLAAVEAARKAEQAAEVAGYTRSITAAQAYWDKRIAQTIAANEAIVLANKKALLAANTRLDASVTDRSQQQGIAAVAGGKEAQAAQRAAELKKTEEALQKTTSATALWHKTVAGVGLAFAGLFAVIAGGVRILFPILNGLFLLYLVLDVTGLLEKVGEKIQWFTDKLGLSSKAERDHAIQVAKTREEEEKRIKVLEDQAAAYQKLRDVNGTTVTAKTFESIEGSFSGKNADGESAQGGLKKLSTILTGTTAEVEAATARIAQLQATAIDGAAGQIDNAKRKVLQLEKELERLKKFEVRTGTANPAATSKVNKDLDEARKLVNTLETGLENATRSVEAYRKSILGATQDHRTAMLSAAQLFNDQTLDAAKKFVLPLKEAQEAQNKAVEAFQAQGRLMATMKDGSPEKVAAQKELDRLGDEAKKAQQKVGELDTKFKDFLKTMAETPKLVKAAKDAIAGLGIISTTTTAPEFRELVNSAEAAKASDVPLTGKKAEALPKPSTGTRDFSAKDREADARRLASAQREAARQITRNEINEAKARNEQLAQVDEQLYERGLLSLEEYYASRKRLSKTQSDDEIRAKTQELAQIEKQIKDGEGRKDPAEKVKMESDRKRLQSELRVLENQAQTSAKDIQFNLEQAKIAFADALAIESADFLAGGLVPADPAKVFGDSLDAYQRSLRKRFAELKTEAAKGSEEAKKLIEALNVIGVFKAADTAMAGINARIQLTNTAMEQYVQKLNILKEQGLITSTEMENAIRDQAAVQATVFQGQIAEAELQLEKLRTSPGVTQESPVFQQKMQELEQLRIKLMEVQLQGNETAIAINQQITSSLGQALGTMKPTLKGMKEALLGFLQSVASNIQQTLGNKLAEQIMVSMGWSGKGGLGGKIQKSIDADSRANPANAAGVALAKDMAPGFGATQFNPLWVRDVNDVLNPLQGKDIPGKNDFKTLFGGTGGVDADKGLASSIVEGESGGVPDDSLIGAITRAVTDSRDNVQGTPLGPLGASPLAPVYVKDVSKGAAAGGKGGGILGDILGGATEGKVLPENEFSTLFGGTGSVDEDKVTAPLVSATSTAANSFLNTIQGGLGDVGSAFVGIFSSILGGGKGGGGGGGASALIGMGVKWLLTAFGMPAGIMHTGGIVGEASAGRFVNPALFRDAMRYHSGGTVGLKPNEVPIIAEKGEQVLTKAQQASGGGGGVNIRQVLVTDKNFVPDAMASAEGEKVLFTWLQNNRATVKSLLR